MRPVPLRSYVYMKVVKAEFGGNEQEDSLIGAACGSPDARTTRCW
jgi:hypothetical protein